MNQIIKLGFTGELVESIQEKFALKKTYSFVPKELMIFKVEDKYNGFTQYLGKNAYGAEGISKSYFEFDLEGNVVLKFTN